MEDFREYDVAGDGRDADEAARCRHAHTAPGPVLARVRAEVEQEPSWIDRIIDRFRTGGKRVDDSNFGLLAAQFLRDHGIEDVDVCVLLTAWIRDLVDPAIDDRATGALLYPRLTATARASSPESFRAFQRIMGGNKVVSIGIPDLTINRYTPRIIA